METTDALRETSDTLLRDLDVLVAIEEEKRTLEPGDPRRVELAGRIEVIAQRVLAGTVRQHQLTQIANAEAEAGSNDPAASAIDETRRPISAILAEWRDAERAAAAAEPGSADAAEADAMVVSLRDEYRRAYEAARRDG